MRGTEELLPIMNLNVRFGELKNLPCLKSKSISFLLALFFFLSIPCLAEAWIKPPT
jgi:hypothetical protein